MNDIAVIIPMYNSLKTLGRLVSELHSALQTVSKNYEIILVDDCGPEPVWPKISELASQDERVKGIKLSRNFGQHPAISAGLAVADAKWYVVMDGDLQDLPSAIPDLYQEALRTNSDSVIARRADDEVKRSKKLGSIVFNGTLEFLADIPASSDVGNFRIFNHRMAAAFQMYPEQMRLFPAIMSHTGFDISYLDVKRAERIEGKSNYTFWKLFPLAFDTIISNSIKPMYFLTGFGLLVSMLAFVFAATLIIRKVFFGIDVEGWASLMTAMMLFGGVQVFVISFVGIYVGKVFFEVKRRPSFIISRTTYE